MQRAEPNDVWERVAPQLGAALAELGEMERNAVLLHYFEHKRLREVGLALGMSEDTAQKWVSRAIQKLRKRLVKRGVALPVVVIPGLLLSHGAQAVPACLSDSIAAAALGETALSTPVFALLQQAARGNRQLPWPKSGGALSKVAGVAIVTGLAVHFWPKQDHHSPPGYSFERTIVVRPHSTTPPSPRVAPTAAAQKLVLSPVRPSPPASVVRVEKPPQIAMVTNTPVYTNFPVALPVGAEVETVGLPTTSPVVQDTSTPPQPPTVPVARQQAMYPYAWNPFAARWRIPPGVYVNLTVDDIREQAAQARPQPAFNSGGGPWMPVQRSATPARTPWNSSTQKKHLQ